MEKKITIAANIAILVVAVVALALLVESHTAARGTSRSAARNPSVLIGKLFPLERAWSPYRKTVVLALSVGCHYCSASAPFYRALTEAAPESRVSVLALLPQEQNESNAYLRGLGLNIPAIGKADFGQLQVSGTPTLFVVDARGIVEKVWIGQLREDAQKNLLAFLQQ